MQHSYHCELVGNMVSIWVHDDIHVAFGLNTSFRGSYCSILISSHASYSSYQITYHHRTSSFE